MDRIKEKTHIASTSLIILILVPVLAVSFISGCSKKGNETFAFQQSPFLPAEYWNCTEVEPQALVNAYCSGYGDLYTKRALWDGVVFIFKNVTIDKRTLLGLNEGYIWVDRIECYLAEPDVMREFKVGDKVDVVGVSYGPTNLNMTGLTFKKCYVLPAGLLLLPAGQGSSTFTAGY